MRPQSPEHHRPDHEGNAGNAPEPEGHPPVLPEPHLVNKTLAVSLDDVERRVEFQQKMERRRQYFQVPENGGQVESNLQDQGDQGAQVAKEDDYR